MWQGDDPVTSASQRDEAIQPRRVSADSFRMLTERLKKPAVAAHIPNIVPDTNVVPISQPVPHANNRVSPPLAASPNGPIPDAIVIAPVQPEQGEAVEGAISPASQADDRPSLAAASPVREQELARTAWNEKVPLPVQPAPIMRPASAELAQPSLVIGSERISSVLARNEPADLSSLKLPPILPPPEPPPPKPPELPKAAIETLQTDHIIQAHPRRKLAPSDPELDMVMRMIASLPSLDERAAYLEEAALYEQQAASAPVVSEPVEDLEALAMQHVAGFEQDTNFQATKSEGISKTDVESAVENSFADAYSEGPGTSVLVPSVSATSVLDNAVVNEPTATDPAAFGAVEDDAFATVQIDKLAQPEEQVTKKNSSESFSVDSSEPFASSVAEAQAALAAATHTIQQPRTSRLRKSAQTPPRAKSAVELPSSVSGLSEAEVEDLSRSLLDMMASGANAGLPQERALAADTLLRIVPGLPLRPLVHMAERMAMMETPPHMIVARLLMDHRLEVAGPLLENATSVPDQELFPVIQEGNHQKLRLLARRRKLSRTLTDMLVTVENSSVLLTLVRNAYAEISHAGFLSLTESAMDEPDILAPLCTRADLPAPQAFELFWLAPAQLRRYLLSRFLTDSQTLTKILRITMATQGEKLSTENFPDPLEVNWAIADVLQGQSEEGCEKLAQMAQIDTQTARRIIGDSLGEPLIALLKSLGYPRSQLDDVLLSMQQSDNGSIDATRERSELTSLFDTLSFNKARILLTYWDWSTLRTGPYAPVH
jgi:uncharacterized protein (DUF2336 family)